MIIKYCDRCGAEIKSPFYHLISGEYICEKCLEPTEFFDELTENDILYNIVSRVKNLDDAREDLL